MRVRLLMATLALLGSSLPAFAHIPANSPFSQVVHALPPGGPAPRLSDGHVDFTGRYYPNKGGKMLDSATPGRIDPGVGRNFDSRAEEKLSFKLGMAAKYMSPVPYGTAIWRALPAPGRCKPASTPPWS